MNVPPTKLETPRERSTPGRQSGVGDEVTKSGRRKGLRILG